MDNQSSSSSSSNNVPNIINLINKDDSKIMAEDLNDNIPISQEQLIKDYELLNDSCDIILKKFKNKIKKKKE